MNRVVSLACLAISFAVALAIAPRNARAEPKKSVAILGLELKDDGGATGSGIDERSANIARVLTTALRNRAKVPNGPYSLAAGGEKDLVDAQLLAGCDGATVACMSKIGAEMAADFLIYGRLEKQGKGFQVSLTLLDVVHKSVVRTLPDIIPSGETGEIALDRWGKSLYGRLAGESNKGTLVVTANVDSGQVFVDGENKANLVKGQARVQGLEEGKHKLAVESGGVRKEVVVTINGGDTTEQKVALDKVDTGVKGGPGSDGGIKGGPGSDGTTVGPGGDTGGVNISTSGSVSHGKPGGFWRKTAIASGVVAAVAGGAWFYSYSKIKSSEKTLCTGRHSPANDPGCIPNPDMGKQDSAEDSGKLHHKLTYAETTITIAAGGLLIVSVFKGFIFPGKEQPDQTSEPGGISLGHGKNAPVVTPVVTRDGAGATLRIDW